MDKAVKEAFPEAEVRYLRWPPATRDIFPKENLNIEKNGAEVGMPILGILEVASKKNILVFNNSGRTANAVAEFTIGHMRAISRNINMGYHIPLNGDQIKGAALDVFWQEPPSKDDPLLKLDNVSLTPHLAGGSVQTTWLTIWLFLESLQEFLKTYQSRSIVNFKPSEQTKIALNMKLVKSDI